jgi:hypothetical protein
VELGQGEVEVRASCSQLSTAEVPPTHELETCLARMAGGDGLDTDNEVITSCSQRANSAGINSLWGDKTDNLEIPRSWMQLLERMQEHKRTWKVGGRCEEGDNRLRKSSHARARVLFWRYSQLINQSESKHTVSAGLSRAQVRLVVSREIDRIEIKSGWENDKNRCAGHNTFRPCPLVVFFFRFQSCWGGRDQRLVREKKYGVLFTK